MLPFNNTVIWHSRIFIDCKHYTSTTVNTLTFINEHISDGPAYSSNLLSSVQASSTLIYELRCSDLYTFEEQRLVCHTSYASHYGISPAKIPAIWGCTQYEPLRLFNTCFISQPLAQMHEVCKRLYKSRIKCFCFYLCLN